MPVTEQGLILADGPHTEAFVAAAVVVHAAAARTEVEVPRVAREVGVERPRPVAAVDAGTAKPAVPTAAGGGQKEAVAV